MQDSATGRQPSQTDKIIEGMEQILGKLGSSSDSLSMIVERAWGTQAVPTAEESRVEPVADGFTQRMDRLLERLAMVTQQIADSPERLQEFV